MTNEQIQTMDKPPKKEETERQRLKKEILASLNNCAPLIPTASLEEHSEKINNDIGNYPLADLKSFADTLQEIPPLVKQFKLLLSQKHNPTNFFIKIIPIYNKVDPLTRKINKKINYELIPNILTIANYYLELKILKKNISNSGYPDNLLERVQYDIDNSKKNILRTNFLSLNNTLEEITKKIKHANENFDKDNPLSFTEMVSSLFNVNFHD